MTDNVVKDISLFDFGRKELRIAETKMLRLTAHSSLNITFTVEYNAHYP